MDKNDSDDDNNEPDLDGADRVDKIMDYVIPENHAVMKTDDRYKSNPIDGSISIRVKDIHINQIIPYQIRFYSGSSNVRVNYKIERTELPKPVNSLIIKSNN